MLDPAQMRARQSLTHLGSLVVPHYPERLWWYHKQVAEALEGVLRYVRFRGTRGGYARVVISLPPQHGKTLHGIELFPALALGQDPDLKIIVASNGGTLAKKGIGNCRQWMTHPAYKDTFSTRFGRVEEIDPRTGKRARVIDAESSAQFFKTLKPNPHRDGGSDMAEGHGYYLAQGMGGSITGWGYDIGIMDDLVKNAEAAQSPTQQAKLWEFYISTFDTRERDEFSAQIYIGTRWTSPDFADELIEYWQTGGDGGEPLPMKVLSFPAIAEEPIDESDPREVGVGLDNPDHRSISYYARKKAQIMTRNPAFWFGPYQQRPKLAGSKFFQANEWLIYDETFNAQSMLDLVDFSIDCNLAATGASYTVILVTGVLTAGSDDNDAGEHYFLLDEARGHWSYEELEIEFVRLRKKWEAALPRQTIAGSVWVENKALGPTLISKYSDTYPIVAVPKARSKIVCYRIASPVTSQRRVRIPRGTWGTDPTNPMLPLITDEWVGDAKTPGSWVHELGSYPSKPDDRRDTLAQQIICRTSWLGVQHMSLS